MKNITIQLVLGLTSLMLCGCAENWSGRWAAMSDDGFIPEDAPRAINDFARSQTAVEARANATLYASHFDGANLNGLGVEKINLMIEDGSATPLIVYVAPTHTAALATHRIESVRNYLKEAGMDEKDYLAQEGRNPNSVSPSAPNLARLPRTDSAAAAPAQGADMTAAAGTK